MTSQTPLDLAHAASDAAPQSDTARLRFFERLAEAELFLALEAEPEGDVISPRVFPVDGTSYVIAFDLEERLTTFTGTKTPFAAMSGRVLAGMLAGQNLGLALNIEVAPSGQLLPPDAIAWLHSQTDRAPREVTEWPEQVNAPTGIPETVLAALDAKLATAEGRATSAYLVNATHSGGRNGHMLVFVDPAAGAEGALARAIQEVLTFSGLDAAQIDVGFVRAADPFAAKLARVGLRFDLPQPDAARALDRPAPGSDPDAPPILR